MLLVGLKRRELERGTELWDSNQRQQAQDIIDHQLGAAVEDMAYAVELNPQQVKYHHGLGLALETMGQYRQAEECFEKCIEMNADFVDAKYHSGLCAQAQAKFEQAEHRFTETLQAIPPESEMYTAYALLLMNTHQYEKAIDVRIYLEANYIFIHNYWVHG